MNSRAFSKIWIVVIVAVLAAGGFFAWQYFGAPREEIIESDIISINYTSEDWALVQGHRFEQIEIRGSGDFNSTHKLEDKIQKKFDGKLSDAELEELSKLILAGKFFILPEDLSGPTECRDAQTENLKITMKTSEGEITHLVGGYCIQDESFSKIINKISRLVYKSSYISY